MPDCLIQRVLMTGDTVGGVWTFALDLAEALQPFDVSVAFAAMGREPTKAQLAEVAAIPNLLLFAKPYKLEWMDDPWDDVEASGRWVLDLEDWFRPDVVHLNTFGHGCLPFRAPTLLTAHSCVLSWWKAVKKESAPPGWNRYRDEVGKSLCNVGLITAPSRAMLLTLESNYGSGLAPATVVPNGRNPAYYRVDAKQPLILAAGRLWDEAKNISSLARAAGSIRWPVYIAGDDQHPSGGVRDFPGCCKLGRLSPPGLAAWFARASIYVLPARYEPFGLSVLEAALSGCALVLGDIASLRETWEDAALFVPPDDPEYLVAALHQLIAKPALREQMCRRSMARAATFTSVRMAREYAGIYDSLMTMRRTACAS